MNQEELCLGCMEARADQNNCPHCGWQHDKEPESLLHLPPGTVLFQKYLIGRVLGQGGFGITYLAWDMNLDIKLAIKEFFPQGLVTRIHTNNEVTAYSGDLKEQYSFGLDRFLNEAKTLAKFAEHPNMVTVRDFFQANGTAYMVMNYIDGLTLEDYLIRNDNKITFQHTLDIMMPVMDALKAVHDTGILHRDISPDNIFINTEGRVILIDFGAARQDMREKSKSLSVILKAGYAPEEQYRSRGKQGPWTDVYAVAATMYRSITGEIPLESIDRMAEDELLPPSSLGSYISKQAEKDLLKAMSVTAKDRYQDIEAFQQAIGKTVDAKDSVPVFDNKHSEINKPQHRNDSDHEKAIKEKQYIVDKQNGNIPIYNLNIGDRVVDNTWKWEHRTGPAILNGVPYSGRGIIKPIIWIVVAKNHYAGINSHVTLLSQEIIGCFPFDSSKKWLVRQGRNHWGGSGKPNATYGIRKFLNGSSYSGVDINNYSHTFYDAMSAEFKSGILTTTLPNKLLSSYEIETKDKIFLPSTTELGDREHAYTYKIGSDWGYFANSKSRVAILEGHQSERAHGSNWIYWTRSPNGTHAYGVCYVDPDGSLGYYRGAHYANGGVRPALNLKSEIKVSVTPNEDGVYEIVWE